MATGQLTRAFSKLSVNSGRCQPAAARVSSSRGVFLGGQRLSASAQSQQVVECTTEIVCRKGTGKLKTRKAASKRFKVTPTGKVMRRHSNKQHLNEKMKRQKIRDLTKKEVVNSRDIPNVKACLPYAGVKKH